MKSYGDHMGNGHGGGDGGGDYKSAHRDFAAGAKAGGGIGLDIQNNPPAAKTPRAMPMPTGAGHPAGGFTRPMPAPVAKGRYIR